jgi:uncharacterized metal-binding protein YceD (DUF177 family)
MLEAMKVYIDRLRDGHTEVFDAEVDPSFLEVDEPELTFRHPVKLVGKAYLAHDELVLNLTLSTQATVPCAICNDLFAYPIAVQDIVHVEPLSAVTKGIFDMSPVVREAILLEVPLVAECHGGICPERKEIEKFLKKEEAIVPPGEEPGPNPFLSLSSEEDSSDT